MHKKLLAWSVAVILLGGCAPWTQIVKSSQPLDSYGKIAFAGFENSDALSKVDSGDTDTKDAIDVMEKQVTGDVNEWISSRKAGANGKTVTLKISLNEFKRRGAFSSGRIIWTATFTEDGKIVGQGQLTEKYDTAFKSLVYHTVFSMTKRYVELN